MAVAVSYPGVYIQEVPSGSRAIAGVPTSVAAFVGFTARGPVNVPAQLFSFADFERRFGGLNLASELGYAVSHFFLNGGATAWVVRVASGAASASVAMETPGGTLTLTATATSEGLWGNALVIGGDHATANPASLFNLTVTEMVERNGRLVPARSETHRNLSMNAFAATYAVDAVNATSDLIALTNEGAAVTGRGESRSTTLTDAVAASLNDDRRRLAISLDGGPFYEFDLFDAGGSLANLAAIATAIQAQVRLLEPGNAAFDDFESDIDASQIRARSGTADDQVSAVAFAPASMRSAAAVLTLGLANGGREIAAAASVRPAPTGTTGARIEDFGAIAFNDPEPMAIIVNDAAGTAIDTLNLTLQDTGAATPVAAPASLDEVRTRIEAALRASPRAEFAQGRVAVVDGALVVTPGGTGFSNHFVVTGTGADALLVSAAQGGEANVAGYQPGVGPSSLAQVAGTPGNDGGPPSALEVLGVRAAKTGIFALEDIDLFNILNLPGISDIGVLSNAIAYAEERRSMILIDMPATVDDFDGARDWIGDPALGGALRHRNAATYFPRVRLADPLQGNRLRSFANAGVVAGLYARTDARRGVWKAPAGIEATLTGVQALDYVLSDPENGVLNPLGLNALRSFPVFGSVAWGARTMRGADALTDEWKYVPVRRIALFIEESLYRGTQFVVFEPNDEPLWAQIRLSVGSFMNNLFRQGAFQGKMPQEAYLVRCDSTTTTQADIDLGIVNIIVGFAPLKPAEFVIIHIQQLAGQSQA